MPILDSHSWTSSVVHSTTDFLAYDAAGIVAAAGWYAYGPVADPVEYWWASLVPTGGGVCLFPSD